MLQIKLLGDDSREPSSWKLFADGTCVADGSGAFARECFYERAEVFLDLCRDAVEAAGLRQWSEREYELLSAARGIAGGVDERRRCHSGVHSLHAAPQITRCQKTGTCICL